MKIQAHEEDCARKALSENMVDKYDDLHQDIGTVHKKIPNFA